MYGFETTLLTPPARRLTQALAVLMGLEQGGWLPFHWNEFRCSVGDGIQRAILAIGVGHIGFDVDYRRIVQCL